SRRRHTRFSRDWSSDVCSSDLEGHVAVARRTIDDHAAVHQALTGGVDVVDLKRQVAEVAAAVVVLIVPVVGQLDLGRLLGLGAGDRKSTRLNSSHVKISYAVFC